MKVNFEALIKADFQRAALERMRLNSLYGLWFAMYADPLSDDILSDIHEQAMSWVKNQMEAQN